MIVHAKIKRFENPETDAYDRYSPRLNKHASAVIQEWCDEVLFAITKVFTTEEDLGFNKKRTVAKGGELRVLKTTEAAGWYAKNRLSMPAEIPFSWADYQKCMK